MPFNHETSACSLLPKIGEKLSWEKNELMSLTQEGSMENKSQKNYYGHKTVIVEP